MGRVIAQYITSLPCHEALGLIPGTSKTFFPSYIYYKGYHLGMNFQELFPIWSLNYAIYNG